ncbi:MAG: hypothetical protein HYV07_04510 [Deltaproteobacteria bacterium]|nr:hypothetical protein [Deltaproteobacteria bacterium]
MSKVVGFAIGGVVLALGIAVAISSGGLSVGGREIGGSTRAWIEKETLRFVEDLQFKDFDRAASHHLIQKKDKRDIAALIKQVFKVRHELLDIHHFRVVQSDMDEAGKRARVRVNVQFNVLGPAMIREKPESKQDADLMFYWFQQDDGTWGMELR